MAKSNARLNVIIATKVQGFNRSLRKMERGLGRFQRQVSGLGDSITTGIALPFAAAIGTSLKLFDAQAKAVAQVEAGIKSTGGAAGFTSKELQKMASSLQGDTIFGDEQILKDVTAQLLTFTNIAGEQFDKTQMAALDLATRLGTDLKSASIQLGKALNDPILGLSSLSRSGIQFSESQKAVIKSLVETGKTAEAQNIILKELENQFGGSAAAAAEAGLGPIQQFKNAIGDVGEIIGEIALPYITEFAKRVKNFVERIRDMDTAVIKSRLKIVAIVSAFGVALSVIGRVIGAVKSFIGVFRLLSGLLLTNPFGLIVTAISLVVGGLVLAYNKSLKFRAVMNGVGAVAKEMFLILKESLAGFISAYLAFKDGEIKKGFSLLGEALVKSNPLGIAITQGKRLGSTFADAVAETYIEEFTPKIQAATIEAVDKIDLPTIGTPPTGTQTGGISGGGGAQRLQGVESIDFGKAFNNGELQEFGVSFNETMDGMLSKYSDVSRRIVARGQENTEAIKNNLAAMKAAAANTTAATVQSFGAVISGIQQIAGKSKVFALLEIAVNSAVGVARAIAAGAGQVWPANIAAIASGVAAVLSGIGQAKALFSKAPSLAEGGLISRPTLAMIGDSPHGPEAVIPLRKMDSMLDKGPREITGRLYGNGRDLVGVIDYYNTEADRFS